MKKTIISHIYNEEYLLPWWLEHHKKIFDHGVIIDYRSTDNSVDIIKKICPTWDIITTRNKNFQAAAVDIEVMYIERQIEGWKTCLNTTEFLIGDYSILTEEPTQLLVPTIIFIDNNESSIVNKDIPLYKQKTYGINFPDSFFERSSRSFHNYSIIYPTLGRHFREGYNTDKLAIFYYGWSPFDQGQIKRKLQIQSQIPQSDLMVGNGGQHVTDEQGLRDKITNLFLPKSKELKLEIQHYIDIHEKLTN